LFLATTVVALVLLFSYRTSRGPGGTAPAAAAGNQPGIVSQPGLVDAVPSTGSSSGSGASSPAGGTGSTTGSTGSGSPGATVVNGTVANTRWGPMQVRVTINSGKITDVQAILYPHGNGRDAEINAYALPQLRSEVLAAQSANIDVVSGATVSSDGYIESLQAALDMAHFG
jgi:uncharacterized protein with FMN-binding domain